MLNSAVINLDQVEFSGRLVVRAGNMSNRMPFYATSSGKAIAAYLPEAELKSLMESTFISLTGGTITDKEVFKRELKQVRAQGYATAFEELEEGLNSVAAPVFNHRSAVIASVGVSGPNYRLNHQRIKQITPKLMERTDQISKELGYISGH